MNKVNFSLEDNFDLSQITLTGARALALIGMLIVEPRTFEEIKNAYIKYGLCDKNPSDDIVRVDIGTIKSIGCEISRPCSSNGYKYIIEKHPFSLCLDEKEVKLLKRVYTKVRENASLDILITFDDLFKKLAERVDNKEIKEQLLGISVLKYYDVNEVKEFYLDCQKQKKMILLYKNIVTNKESEKRIKTQKFVMRNNKLYLYGYDLDLQASTMLHYKRIQKIIAKNIDETKISPYEIVITYRLKDFGVSDLEENELIIGINKEEYTIRGTYHNDFIAMQRVLSFGSKCIVDSPMEFRQKVIDKLKSMKEVYNG